MIRTFCDDCGKELFSAESNAASKRLMGSNLGLNFEIIVGQNGTWNAGHYCKYCVLDAIRLLDDRPAPTPEKPQQESEER